jgi:hypothetical protein
LSAKESNIHDVHESLAAINTSSPTLVRLNSVRVAAICRASRVPGMRTPRNGGKPMGSIGNVKSAASLPWVGTAEDGASMSSSRKRPTLRHARASSSEDPATLEGLVAARRCMYALADKLLGKTAACTPWKSSACNFRGADLAAKIAVAICRIGTQHIDRIANHVGARFPLDSGLPVAHTCRE